MLHGMNPAPRPVFPVSSSDFAAPHCRMHFVGRTSHFDSTCRQLKATPDHSCHPHHVFLNSPVEYRHWRKRCSACLKPKKVGEQVKGKLISLSSALGRHSPLASPFSRKLQSPAGRVEEVFQAELRLCTENLDLSDLLRPCTSAACNSLHPCHLVTPDIICCPTLTIWVVQ